MNILRATFNKLFVLTVLLLSIYALVQIFRGVNPILSWLGLLIAATTPLLFLIRLQFFKANNLENPVGFSAFCGLGVAICMAASWKYGKSAGVIHIWAGVCLIAWVLYLRWNKAKPKH